MIYIIIPVHNRRHYTQACLKCLSQQNYRDFKIIIVDDGSTDGTAGMITQNFPDVTVLAGDGNLWWTESTNIGIQYAIQDGGINENNFILTLNDDLEVKSDYLSSLLSVYETYKPCLVGSACVDISDPNRLEYAGSKVDLIWSGERPLSNLFERNHERALTYSSTIESDSLPGRGVLIPFVVFEKIGFYDSVHFKQYMADIEFSIRAKKSGYRLIVSMASIVYGHIDATGLQLKPDLSFRKFWKGLSSTRSPINLSLRYHFAMRHSPTKLLYFILDVGRIFTGYFKRRFRLNQL